MSIKIGARLWSASGRPLEMMGARALPASD
jgi:hypothetical protein